MRVWLPDRPGALGAVASRIGAVRGDLTGIDILERGGGLAIDELEVDLPDESLVPMVITEVQEVDGVEVEDVRLLTEAMRDSPRDALDTAVVLVGQLSTEGLLATLVHRSSNDFEAEWAVVAEPDEAMPLASTGTPPPAGWLGAFLAGSSTSELVAAGACGPDDVAWATLATAGVSLVLGRRGRPFRARERRQLGSLARIADARWAELERRVDPLGDVQLRS